MQADDTIAAIATAPGEAGVGIIRISGPEAPQIAERIWRGQRPLPEFESHKLYYGEIGEPVLDSAMIVWMQAPSSYTGEDIIELQCHGGPALLQEILQAVLRAGARLARPGEFTERAFVNGRLDLSQAEGVADLIHGQSELALDLARDQLSGRLSEAIGKLRRELVVMRAQLEAMIDYPEDEDVNVLRHDEVGERCERVTTRIGEWLVLFDEGRRRREGVRLVLVGRPNVGKSSLLNCLLSADRAIVHDEAGTTRDVVSESVQLGGIAINMSDTAGLRTGEGDLEAEGIRRSWAEVERADLIILVLDRSQPLIDEDKRIYEEVRGKPHIIALNKCDLPARAELNWAGPATAQPSAASRRRSEGVTASPAAGGANSRQSILEVSAKMEEGLPALKQAIIDLALPHGRASDQLFISNLRHKNCLENSVHALNEVRKSAGEGAGLEFLAADLLVAANHLGEVTGEITNEEVLGEIFARFCLGK